MVTQSTFEASQTCSVDAILTQDNDVDEEESQGENISVVSADLGMKENLVRGNNKQRLNKDYMHRKKHKRTKPLPAITLDAVRTREIKTPLMLGYY